MIPMITALSTTHMTIHASTSGMPSTSGSGRLTNGTPNRMPIKGRAASNRSDMATPLSYEKKRNVASECEANHSMLANAPRKAAKNTEGLAVNVGATRHFSGHRATDQARLTSIRLHFSQPGALFAHALTGSTP